MKTLHPAGYTIQAVYAMAEALESMHEGAQNVKPLQDYFRG